MKRKVAIVSPMKLPLPLVKGGGAESLIQILVDENEKLGSLELTIISVHDKNAVAKSRQYLYTKFKYYKTNSTIFVLKKKILKIIKKVLKRNINIYDQLARKIAGYLNDNQFDHIVVENNYDLLPRLVNQSKARVIYHVHNDHMPQSNPINYEVLNKCHSVIAVSEYIRHRIVDRYDIDSKKVVVLKNCIRVDAFSREKDQKKRIDQRQSLGIPVNDTVVMYGGRIVPEKGVKELILAFIKLNNFKNLKLMIVGSSWYGEDSSSPYLEELKSIAKPISDRIIFTGFVDYNQMPGVYNLADIVVMPTLYVEEAAGLVLLEAMAMKLPIITTDSGGIPEYVTDKNAKVIKRSSQFVDDLFASLSYLIDRPELQKTMGDAGFEWVQKYDSCRYFGHFVEILSDCT